MEKREIDNKQYKLKVVKYSRLTKETIGICGWQGLWQERVFKYIRNKINPSNDINPLLNGGGKIVNNDVEKADMFNTYSCSISEKKQDYIFLSDVAIK